VSVSRNPRSREPEPRRRAPRTVAARIGGRALAGCRRNPGGVLAALAVLGCSGAVAWNVLMHQPTRHPAPLFRPAVAARPAAPPRRPDTAALQAPAPATAAPLPVRRPEGTAFLAPPPAGPSIQLPMIEAPAPTRVAVQSGSDPIGALIRASDPARGEDSPKVASAQKALTKLGYGPLRPDGVMGATTRQAVERFERDNNLPVTGALGSRTTRQLASLSGTQIE
jgi:hypothetical protein